MKKLRFTEAQIVQILGQAEASDITVAEVCRLNGISENTFYRWRKRYRDMQVSEVRRLRELEAENACLKRLRRYPRRGDEHCILGKRLSSGSSEARAALARGGRYQEAAAGLRVRELRITEDERYVVCHNPEAAAGEAALCEHLLARLTETIAGTDKLSPTRRAEPFDCPCFGSARASRPGRRSPWAGNRLAARVSPQRAYRGSQTSDREP